MRTTHGNPFNLEAVSQLAKEHDLWLIEDCCDAVGAEYAGQKVGTFGDIATVSFYPAHHMTMGEGGAVLTQSPKLKKLLESFRDWDETVGVHLVSTTLAATFCATTGEPT